MLYGIKGVYPQQASCSAVSQQLGGSEHLVRRSRGYPNHINTMQGYSVRICEGFNATAESGWKHLDTIYTLDGHPQLTMNSSRWSRAVVVVDDCHHSRWRSSHTEQLQQLVWPPCYQGGCKSTTYRAIRSSRDYKWLTSQSDCVYVPYTSIGVVMAIQGESLNHLEGWRPQGLPR